MNIEDIKVGETYFVRVKVTDIKENFFYAITEVKGEIERYCFYKSEAELFSPITSTVPTGGMLHQSDDDWATKEKKLFNLLNGRKNTESTPKYDPNRKFRKGDKVRFKEYLGRRSLAHTDEYITLDSDEKHGQCFWTGVSATGDIWPRNAYFCYLELVTPVEELEPYSVVDAHTHWDVADKNMKTVATYSKGYHTNAKAAAEAERDRLNAEYRKERSND